MTDDVTERAAGPRAVLRVLDILMTLATHPDGCTLTQIGGALSLPKTSAFSLLKTLEAGGYLRQSNGKYLLGAAALKLGTSIAQAISFPQCVRPVLEQLARHTGETAMLGVLSEQGHEVAYVDVIESDAALRFTVRSGNRRPLYAAASGKALLAFMPEPAQQAYFANAHFIQFTADTSDKAALAAILPDIKRRGVVLDANGIVDAASALASPCFDDRGRVFCSISLAGPTGRIIAQRAEFERLVFNAGEEISRILGYQGPYPATEIPG